MADQSIEFHSLDIPFQLRNRSKYRLWLHQAIKAEKKKAGIIQYIFCAEAYLYQLNKQFLNHDTYTDTITFDYSEKETISGDIFISIERIKENALKYKVSFGEELSRVMVHGVLHLCGYKDKKTTDKQKMLLKEDFYLQKLKN